MGLQLEKIRLHIAQITPGMKLAEPITNAGGITLMPAGIRLTPMFIARIKKWNIDTLEVLVDKVRTDQPEESGTRKTTTIKPRGQTSARTRPASGGGEDALSTEEEQFARSVASDVSKAFINVRRDPLMMQLRTIVIKRLVALGPDSVLNSLRRGPLDEIPLPEENG